MARHNYAEKSIRIESICNVLASDVIYDLHQIFKDAVNNNDDDIDIPTHHEIICPSPYTVSGELMEDMIHSDQKITSLEGLKSISQLTTLNRFEAFAAEAPSFIRGDSQMNFLFTGSWIYDYINYASALTEEEQKEIIKYLINTNEKLLSIPKCDVTIIIMQSEKVIIREFLDMNPDVDFEDYLNEYRTKKRLMNELMDNHGVKVILADKDGKRMSNKQISEEIIKEVYGG